MSTLPVVMYWVAASAPTPVAAPMAILPPAEFATWPRPILAAAPPRPAPIRCPAAPPIAPPLAFSPTSFQSMLLRWPSASSMPCAIRLIAAIWAACLAAILTMSLSSVFSVVWTNARAAAMNPGTWAIEAPAVGIASASAVANSKARMPSWATIWIFAVSAELATCSSMSPMPSSALMVMVRRPWSSLVPLPTV
ncbi:hypothetical protein ACIQF6_02010 [Kitasatospora sp. NPDC092948]|uniref:hypothetical protein n=1 Tax=Kitasatospora sp. NPDC092948 TaxID=3364088 RepID=UPI00381D7F36